ncbi:ribonuclease T2-like isoform X3 [Lepisosteus oculatus]|uniref:ribonuclease T2-like isoform X3 n=1 Tax=Lepisosteus oculatus TaxID=7918 RepID=UPI003719918F
MGRWTDLVMCLLVRSQASWSPQESTEQRPPAVVMGSTAVTHLVLLLSPALVLTLTSWDSASPLQSTFCTWECMKFTLLWPGSFCTTLKKIECLIPEYVKTWTIHGLWPMSTGRCCGCWPIFPSDLEELQPELSRLWPTLLKSKSNFTFWALQDAGIEPSCNKSYMYKQIHAALAPVLGELHVSQCVQDEQQRQVWIQVKIPMFKNFTLGCHRHHAGLPASPHPSPGHPCPHNASVYFYPISYDHPDQPCP